MTAEASVLAYALDIVQRAFYWRLPEIAARPPMPTPGCDVCGARPAWPEDDERADPETGYVGTKWLCAEHGRDEGGEA